MAEGEGCRWVVKLMEDRDAFDLEVEMLERVKGEAGVQQIVGVVVDAPELMLVSQYAGQTLQSCLWGRLLSLEQLQDVEDQLKATIQRLHRQGVAHGDVKDDNVCVLLGSRRVLVTLIDFGLAVTASHRDYDFSREHDLYHCHKLFKHMRQDAKETQEEEAVVEQEDDKEVDWFDKFGEDDVEDESQGHVEDNWEDHVEDEAQGHVEDEAQGHVEDEPQGHVEDEAQGHVEDEAGTT